MINKYIIRVKYFYLKFILTGGLEYVSLGFLLLLSIWNISQITYNMEAEVSANANTQAQQPNTNIQPLNTNPSSSNTNIQQPAVKSITYVDAIENLRSMMTTLEEQTVPVSEAHKKKLETIITNLDTKAVTSENSNVDQINKFTNPRPQPSNQQIYDNFTDLEQKTVKNAEVFENVKEQVKKEQIAIDTYFNKLKAFDKRWLGGLGLPILGTSTALIMLIIGYAKYGHLFHKLATTLNSSQNSTLSNVIASNLNQINQVPENKLNPLLVDKIIEKAETFGKYVVSAMTTTWLGSVIIKNVPKVFKVFVRK